MHVNRRTFLQGMAAASALSLLPGSLLAGARSTDARLLVILLRGAMDGLHLLPAVGDPAYARLRGALAVHDGLKLDGLFALHPSMAFAHRLYGQGQLIPIVAIAPPYRQRSHFEAQDCLENGTGTPNGASTGWLGRALASQSRSTGVAVGPVMPLIMRGASNATTWSPPLLQGMDPQLMQTLQALYAEDVALSSAFADAMQSPSDIAGSKSAAFRMPDAVGAAARWMMSDAGPRLGFVSDSGWDTHRGQEAALERKFAELDAALQAARDGFGEAWSRTAVVVVTEFGRTVAVNGSGGTDHGVGGMAMLAGGAVRGGRIAGDWPGLAPADLHEQRDLRATTDMRALFKPLLRDLLAMPESALETQVFPGSAQIRPMEGLFARPS